MPQLDHTTFASQVFWLFVLFTVFYIISIKFILPTISEILKTRYKKLSSMQTAALSLGSEKNDATGEYDKTVHEVFATLRQQKNQINQATTVWAVEQNKKIASVDLLETHIRYFRQVGEQLIRRALIAKV